MEIKQSEDGYYRWRIDVDEIRQGGYRTYQAALDAMRIAITNRGNEHEQ